MLKFGCACAALAVASTSAGAMGGIPIEVPAGCLVPNASTLDCKGDVSTGVAFAPIVTPLPQFTLKVSEVTGDITPTVLPGLWITHPDADVTLDSDLGSHAIITNGWFPGIYAVAGGSISITHRGDITANGFNSFGIYAHLQTCECETKPALAAAFAKPDTLTMISHGDITVGPAGAGIVAIADAGDVKVEHTGNITGGAGSSGVVAASGYGDVTVRVTGDITLDDRRASEHGELSELDKMLPRNRAGIHAETFSAGRIIVSSKGDISTTGRNRDGIYTYSGAQTTYEGLTDVTSHGSITTTGDGAMGIVAGSNASLVNISSYGRITTRGEKADGIRGYSYSDTVAVFSYGDINAPGDGSHAISVRGESLLYMGIFSGTVSGGGGAGSSVAFYGGTKNLLFNDGVILPGVSGWAVEGDTGSDTVRNRGTITGNVELNFNPEWWGEDRDHGTDAFENKEDGTFNSGRIVKLGNGGLLSNEGLINPGGSGAVLTTDLDGRLSQSRSGVLAIDIAGKTADAIDIFTPAAATARAKDQASAVLAGTIAPNLVSFDTSSATQLFTIVKSNGTIETDGLAIAQPKSALLDYDLLYPNTHEVVLQLKADFGIEGLTPNQSAVLDYMGRLLGTADAERVEAIYQAFFAAPDTEGVGALADQIDSEAGANGFTAWAASAAFAQALRSCPVAEGPFGQQRETSCVWATPQARAFNQTAGTNRPAVTGNTSGLMGGVQTELRENVWGGIGFAVEKGSAAADHTTQTDGTWWQAGGVLKWAPGPWKISGSLTAGQGQVDMTRSVFPAGVAASTTDVSVVNGLVRLAYSFGESGLYVTPMVDVGATYVHMDGFMETGAGAFDLAVSSTGDWIFSAGPAVEIGATVHNHSLTFRPFVKAGALFLSENSFDVTARFASLPAGVAFATRSRFDDAFATVDAGVQLFSADGINLKLGYAGRFGANSRESGVDAKLSINY